MIKMSYLAIVTAAIATGFTVSAAGANAQTAAPDTIYFNGKIVTVDRQFAIVEAVAVIDGKFSAVGKSAAIR